MFLWTLTVTLFTAAATALFVLLLDFWVQPRSRYVSLPRALVLYLAKRAARLVAAIKWRQYVRQSKTLREVQEQFVLAQIRANASSAYGRDHNFKDIHSLDEFRRSQPLTTYDDYEPYIARATRGDYQALYGDGRRPQMFGCSSGTTGKSKRIPVSAQQQAAFGPDRLGILYGFHDRLLATDALLMLTTFCAPHWRLTDAGDRVGSVMAMVLESAMVKMTLTLPEPAMKIDKEDVATYLGLLFGLRDADVSVMQGSFASSTFGMLQFLERNWKQMVADLRRGEISENIELPADIRLSLNALLEPEPDRADQLEREFRKGFDGIMSRIFPRMLIIFSNHSGSSMSVYRERCAPYLGDVKLYSHIYVSTEGLLGVNVRPFHERPGYALLPHSVYMEYLPVDDQGQPLPDLKPLEADQVQIGGRYEVVLTNASGFYRYRLGDVVEVVGFFNQIPLVDFLFRSGQLLNVHMEKMTEASFTQALRAAAGRWQGARLQDFTTAESVLVADEGDADGSAPHYLLFLETSGGPPSAEQCAQIDEQLCADHYVYKSFRVKGAIAPIEVIPVREGTFQEYQAHVLSSSSTFASQFKQPRVLRTTAQVQFFSERRVHQAAR